MAINTIIVLCAQALMAQIAFGQCVYPGAQYLNALPGPSCGGLGGSYEAGLGIGSGLGLGAGCGGAIGNGYIGAGLANIDVTPTSGGSLPVTSFSSIAPNGVAVSSENAFEGNLQVIGELPYLSTAALEGTLPSGGAGIVNYGCGNGVTAITNAGNVAGAYGLGGAGFGYGADGYGLGLAGIAPGVNRLGLGLLGNHGYGCGCSGY